MQRQGKIKLLFYPLILATFVPRFRGMAGVAQKSKELNLKKRVTALKFDMEVAIKRYNV